MRTGPKTNECHYCFKILTQESKFEGSHGICDHNLCNSCIEKYAESIIDETSISLKKIRLYSKPIKFGC